MKKKLFNFICVIFLFFIIDTSKDIIKKIILKYLITIIKFLISYKNSTFKFELQNFVSITNI